MSEQTCKIEGCERADIISHGLCGLHRQSRNRPNGGQCYESGCTEMRTRGANRGLCRFHLDEYLAQRFCSTTDCIGFAEKGCGDLCSGCYRAMLKGRREQSASRCAEEGCERAVDIDHSGLCEKHHRRHIRAENRERLWPLIVSGVVKPTRRAINSLGYVALHYPGFWELEHRVVMARAIGRKLRPDENVHHRNGNRADNRYDNLELWTRPQLSGVRVVDLVRQAEDILATYKPSALTTYYLLDQWKAEHADEAAA